MFDYVNSVYNVPVKTLTENYTSDGNGTIRRKIPKVRGKLARKIDKIRRHNAKVDAK